MMILSAERFLLIFRCVAPDSYRDLYFLFIIQLPALHTLRYLAPLHLVLGRKERKETAKIARFLSLVKLWRPGAQCSKGFCAFFVS